MDGVTTSQSPPSAPSKLNIDEEIPPSLLDRVFRQACHEAVFGAGEYDGNADTRWLIPDRARKSQMRVFTALPKLVY